MLLRRVAATLVALLALCLGSAPALAAGLYIPAIGGPGMGRAGADLTDPGDFAVLWYNPAALASAEGVRFHFELTMVNTAMRFDRLDDPTVFDGNGGVFAEVRNEAGPFFIPQLGLTMKLAEGLGLGFGFYAPHAGLFNFPLIDHDGDPETPPLGPARHMVIEAESGQTFVELGLGARITPHLEIGLSAGVSTFFINEKFDAHASLSPDEDPGSDALLTVKAMDKVTPSLGIGARWRPGHGLIFAVSARAPVNVHARGTFELEPGPNLAALGVAVEGENVDVDFHMPLILRAAVGYACPRGIWDAELAFVWENWSSVDGFDIDASEVVVSSIVGKEAIGVLPVDRGLRDAFSTRLGGRVRIVPDHLWLQLGAAFESSGVTTALRSPSTNDPDKLVFGAGITGELWLIRLTLSYQRVQLFAVTITDSENEQLNALAEDAVTIVGNGDYAGHYDAFSVSLAFRLDGLWSRKKKKPTKLR